jgi:hypothetical protein
MDSVGYEVGYDNYLAQFLDGLFAYIDNAQLSEIEARSQLALIHEIVTCG